MIAPAAAPPRPPSAPPTTPPSTPPTIAPPTASCAIACWTGAQTTRASSAVTANFDTMSVLPPCLPQITGFAGNSGGDKPAGQASGTTDLHPEAVFERPCRPLIRRSILDEF